MMRQTSLLRVLFGAALLLPLGAAASESMTPPVAGDPVNGGRLFRVHCAACHGEFGEGNGPIASSLPVKPTNLRDGSYFWAYTPEEQLARMRGEMLAKDAPVHGRGVTELELRDIVEWLEEPIPSLSKIFPASTHYVVFSSNLDADGLERAEKAIGRKLQPDEKAITLFAMMKGEMSEDGKFALPGPEGSLKIENTPRALYDAKPKRRMGFVGFIPLKLDGGTFLAAIALDRSMRLTAVETVPTADAKGEKLRRSLDRTLKSFIGSGGREEKKSIKPQRGGQASKDVLREMVKAYTLVLEAGAMYQKGERDRFWADPDAFKFPAAEDMDEVKFEFKESKKK